MFSLSYGILTENEIHFVREISALLYTESEFHFSFSSVAFSHRTRQEIKINKYSAIYLKSNPWQEL